MERSVSTSKSATTREQAARRVAIVHSQTRPTLQLTVAFTFAAGVAVVVPHHTGVWLPLHLFLLGALGTAISGATQFLAVTWSAAPAPPGALATTQRTLLASGVIGLALGRELDASPIVLGIAGTAVVVSLGLLQVSLARIRSTSKLDRFHPALDGYLVAVGFGLLGCGAGIAMATDLTTDQLDAVRTTHLVLNVFGLVGLVIASTVPYMLATQIRSKMSPRASARALRSAFGLLSAATIVTGVGALGGQHLVTALGFGAYAVGIVATIALCPRVELRHLRWAGPRLVHVVLGIVWWMGTTVGLAVFTGRGDAPPTELLLALAIGGYGQILVGSLAYVGPVLRGGGHERLSAGFALTRSPLAVVAANVAAVGALCGADTVTIAGLAIWLVDSAGRALMLARPVGHGPRPTRPDAR
jgi:nitrite reductase (NO-forming)